MAAGLHPLPHMSWNVRSHIRERVSRERGTIHKVAPLRVALTYPSPYHVGMSSLGFQTLYRLLNDHPQVVAERAFLPDDLAAYQKTRLPLLTYESESVVGEFPVVALSVAYELELGGVVDTLELAGIPPLSRDRNERHPLILMGGPLTFSNPLPLGPFADVMILGEGEEPILQLMDLMSGAGLSRQDLLKHLADIPGFYVPSLHGERLGPTARAPAHLVPARSVIVTPDTELANMFLIEPERGCSRGCTFCVMRRSTNGGMRLNDWEHVLSLIPDWVPRVGLVGAAVTDHPRHIDLVRAIVESGKGIGVSSLRADKITAEFTTLLKAGGYRTMTVASDGASERIRGILRRQIKEKHLLEAARCVVETGLEGMKVYMMLGVPGETEADVDELIGFTKELSKIVPITLGIAPFVPKRNTPLFDQPFTDIKITEARLSRLDKAIRPRAKVKSTSARWAWVEYRLAQGGWEAGLAALQAHKAGGNFSDWKRAFKDLPVDPPWRRPDGDGAPLKMDRLDLEARAAIEASRAEVGA